MWHVHGNIKHTVRIGLANGTGDFFFVSSLVFIFHGDSGKGLAGFDVHRAHFVHVVIALSEYHGHIGHAQKMAVV